MENAIVSVCVLWPEVILICKVSELQLNQAYKCLADTKSRLKHLFQLEFGDGPGELRRIPPDLAEQAFEFGKLCRDADQFLARKAGAVSPLLKVDLLEQGLVWTERFQAWQQKFDRQWSELSERLETLNAAWTSAPPWGDPRRIDQLPRAELTCLFHRCGYLTRWMQQARDRVTQLAF